MFRTECSKPLFQCEAECEATDMKLIFLILLEKKFIFTKKGVAFGLVLKVSFWNSEVDWWH